MKTSTPQLDRTLERTRRTCALTSPSCEVAEAVRRDHPNPVKLDGTDGLVCR